MPAYTTTYLLPSPALGETADGPAAITALAARVERELPVLRAANTFDKEADIDINPNTAVTVHQIDCALAVIGWATVQLQINFGTQDGSTDYWSPIAGYVRLYLDNVQFRQTRYHSQSRTRFLSRTISASKLLGTANTNLNVRADITCDAPSSTARYFHSSIFVEQFGAPAVG